MGKKLVEGELSQRNISVIGRWVRRETEKEGEESLEFGEEVPDYCFLEITEGEKGRIKISQPVIFYHDFDELKNLADEGGKNMDNKRGYSDLDYDEQENFRNIVGGCDEDTIRELMATPKILDYLIFSDGGKFMYSSRRGFMN
tara:strand:+ start:7923 stop:8351 length:429 start_codon:yes stop_codon:yes gene_type:complete